MEPVILKNEYLTVRLSQKGAAIEEVLSSDDEILLVGGDTFSFPVCGAVSGGGAYLGKMHCKMPYGGFAKDKQFEVMEYMDNNIQVARKRTGSRLYSRQFFGVQDAVFVRLRRLRKKHRRRGI